MINTKIILRKLLTVTLSIATITTSILGNCNLTAIAAETSDEAKPLTIAASEDVSTTDAELEKELVQYDDNWCIFHYLDPVTEHPMFDIKYQGKSIEELEAENLSLQFRIYEKNESFHLYNTFKWCENKDSLSDYLLKLIETEKDSIYIQFKIVNDLLGFSISKSNVLLIWPQEKPFPYILSSNIDFCETYDLYFNSNVLNVKLTYNEHLKSTEDILKLQTYANADKNSLIYPYFAENLSFTNYTNDIEVEGTTYSMKYCIVEFTLQISKTCKAEDSISQMVSYAVELSSLVGNISNQKPSNFIFQVMTPDYSSGDFYIDVENIAINSTSNTVEAGNTLQLTSTITPENATNKSITWTSSNENYATVNSFGVVTALMEGIGKDVTITATSNGNNTIKAEFVINITQVAIPATLITLDSTSDTIIAGEKLALIATVLPENATNKTISWSSSNSNYATVDANGIVTTKLAGAGKTVTITARTMDGSNKESSFNLKIKPISVKKVKLSGKKTVKAGKKITLKTTITPSNATNKSVKWTTSNKKYATVSQKGVVKTKKAGKGKTVKITATAKDGSKKKATFKIKIK